MDELSTIGDRLEELAATDLRLACSQARDLVAANPSDGTAVRLLTGLVRRCTVESSPASSPKLRRAEPVRQAAQLIAAGNLEGAEKLLRPHLADHPTDTFAMDLMAEIAARCGFIDDAGRILRHSAALGANSPDALTDLGQTLFRIAGDSSGQML